MAADPTHTDILIVGAGAAGLTLAIDLARRGVGFRLIDKAPAAFEAPAARASSPAAWRSMRTWASCPVSWPWAPRPIR